MKTKSVSYFAILIVGVAFAQTSIAQQTIVGFESPESVIRFGDKFFVSNIGGAQPNPVALDSNGFISSMSPDGSVVDKRWSKSVLNGPKGLAVANNVLYTADINRIVGFNTKGLKVFEMSFPDAGMLNDLCTVNDSTLVVSETVHNKIYLVHLATKVYDFIGRINGANGVTYDSKTKKLFACGMGVGMNGEGMLYTKDLSANDTVFSALQNSPKGIFDGLEMLDDHRLIVTDWVSGAAKNKAGRYVVYDLSNQTYKAYTSPASPADLYYDSATSTIYLPVMMQNSLLIAKLSGLKAQ